MKPKPRRKEKVAPKIAEKVEFNAINLDKLPDPIKQGILNVGRHFFMFLYDAIKECLDYIENGNGNKTDVINNCKKALKFCELLKLKD